MKLYCFIEAEIKFTEYTFCNANDNVEFIMFNYTAIQNVTFQRARKDYNL